MSVYDYDLEQRRDDRIQQERRREERIREDNARYWREEDESAARQRKDEKRQDAYSQRDHMAAVAVLDLALAPALSSVAASTGRDGPYRNDARMSTEIAPRDVAGEYRTEVFMRWQELLTEIAWQYRRPSMSDDEKEYLLKLSSTIETLNLDSVASIDVLKICIFCSRFYPRIDIRDELISLRSAIEAFLIVKAV